MAGPYCVAYVEVKNNSTGDEAYGHGSAEGCDNDSCLKALNIAASWANYYANCTAPGRCVVTYWAYRCQESIDKFDKASPCGDTFTELPSEKRGRI
jgi:hypothetical protein